MSCMFSVCFSGGKQLRSKSDAKKISSESESGIRTATGVSRNPALARYSCPLCGKSQENPLKVLGLFLTFDSELRSENGSGEKQKLMRQIQELTAKNVELSSHYNELHRQERELQSSASNIESGGG